MYKANNLMELAHATATFYHQLPLAASAFFIEALTHKQIKHTSIVLVATPKHVAECIQNIGFFQKLQARDEPIAIRSLGQLSSIQDSIDSQFLDSYGDCVEVLSRTFKGQKLILVTTPAALFQAYPSPESLNEQSLKIIPGQCLNYQKLVHQLAVELNYDAEATCEQPGQFSVRGSIIDIYPPNAQAPYRIDFFDDVVESIRTFDPTTQRSDQPVDCIDIYQVPKDQTTAFHTPLSEYIAGQNIQWFVQEPLSLEVHFPSYFEAARSEAVIDQTFGSLMAQRLKHKDFWYGFSEFEEGGLLFPQISKQISTTAQPIQIYRKYASKKALGSERAALDDQYRLEFLKQLHIWQTAGWSCFLAVSKDTEHDRLHAIIEEHPETQGLKFTYVEHWLSDGFKLSGASKALLPQALASKSKGLICVTEGELLGRHLRAADKVPRRKLAVRNQVDQLLDFSELVVGDYVVHIQQGICIYRGIQKIEAGGKLIEVIALEFESNSMLYLRVHESHLLFRYVGVSRTEPKLGKLGTNQWEKVRQATERGIFDFASELLHVQAQRNHLKGHAFKPDNQWQKEFEEQFPYTETPDQLKAINEAKIDMESEHPMDRLVCGDVGFGKTEVAIRAAFKAVMDGQQVAFLCPTTVLTQQHFTTFRDRMAQYPVVIEMLSRFRTPHERTRILKELAEGTIDIVIGTHSLLSKHMKFKRLGLLIIDEEHRFGVVQKEQIKQLKTTVDILCMSATPIPRSLHLALVGARDLSVIETAPKARSPIQTYIKSYNLKLIKEAIAYEIGRGGQVFYLHNRVESIQTVVDTLVDLFPNLKIQAAHGQMETGLLEHLMTEFVKGTYDILVCTTIIESGLDIPNCNTIIIEGADKFGLSQLYQLRGRVGRFNRQAYCYLLLHKQANLVGEAGQRLNTIKQYNQLGSGFRVAMKDLELRGAGNILGSQQSGHIAAVGFDLYCQLLKQSIAKLKGDVTALRFPAHIKLDFVILGDKVSKITEQIHLINGPAGKRVDISELKQPCEIIEAKIPVEYIFEPQIRIEFYRKLMSAHTVPELLELQEIFEDRFGSIPEALKTLFMVNEIRCIAEEKGIIGIETEGNQLKCKLVNPKKPYIKVADRFPRLTQAKPFLRLKEIKRFLLNLEV